VPALHELADVGFHPISCGAYGKAQGGGGFSLSVAGVNVDIAFVDGISHLIIFLKIDPTVCIDMCIRA
jgi:hypothetical protein